MVLLFPACWHGLCNSFCLQGASAPGSGEEKEDWGEGDLKKVSNSMLKTKISLETLNQRMGIEGQG